MSRWAWADVDLGAISQNVTVLRGIVAPSAVWAVVKADGYGHGAVPVARAALQAGAAGLCVALVQEGVALREAGIESPILVLSEQPSEDLPAAVRHGLTCTVYSSAQIDALSVAADIADRDVDVHIKVDSGMRRVGVDPGNLGALVDAIERASSRLRLAGVFTHLAVADDPEDPFTAVQLDRFEVALESVGGRLPTVTHAANSAGALAHPGARYSFVRAGIAVYGISPGRGVDALTLDLRPAMSLRARVSLVKRVRAGERISYGLRHTFADDSTVATLPIGYADGVPRRLFEAGGEVLVGGRRRPIVGVITMDQIMVDVGDDPVSIGDEAVLIGSQGEETITATEWAERLGTIGYEVVCGISSRVERRYV